MNMTRRYTVTLGDLVAAAFDRAGQVTNNPLVASAIAARRVNTVLERADRKDVAAMLVRTARGLDARPTARRPHVAAIAA
jgi:alkaline phosphatase